MTSDEIHGDLPVARIAVRRSKGRALEFVSERLKNNFDVVSRAVSNSGKMLEHASDNLRSDRGVVLCAVKNHGCALKYASKDLQNNKEVCVCALKQDKKAFTYISSNLRGDKEVILTALGLNDYAREYEKKDWCNSTRQAVMKAYLLDGSDNESSGPVWELRGDRDFIRFRFQQNLDVLKYASVILRGDRRVMLAAQWQVTPDETHQDLEESLWGSKEFVSCVVNREGRGLEYASTALRRDEAFVLSALKQDGQALAYATNDLKGRHGLVLAACSQHEEAIRYADVHKLAKDDSVDPIRRSRILWLIGKYRSVDDVYSFIRERPDFVFSFLDAK